MRNLNETISLESHKVARVDDISSITSEVIAKVNKCKVRYSMEFGLPNYVKIPMRIYTALKATNVIYTEVLEVLVPEMLMGLVVCPTTSIQTVDEIEVF